MRRILHPAITLPPAFKERYALRAEAKGQTQQSERANERNDRTPFYPARVRERRRGRKAQRREGNMAV
jgi:hypothetical protein